MIKGCDISKYQGNVNFDGLKAALDFVIIKCSSGAPDPGQVASQYKDIQFDRNKAEARRVGLLRGFYHYAYPEYNSPEAEAECFHANLGDLQDGEILVLDYESSWAGDPVDWSKRFLDHLSALFGGYKPLVYLNEALLKDHNWGPVFAGNYGLWVARYGTNDGTMQNLAIYTNPWPTAAFWQYTSKGNVDGLSPLDLDIFYGSAAAFTAYGYHPTPPTPPVEPPPMTVDPRDTQIADLQNQLTSAHDRIAELEKAAAQPVPGCPECPQLADYGLRELFSAWFKKLLLTEISKKKGT